MSERASGPRTRFHRLGRESNDFAHWKLPVAALLAFAFFLAASTVIAIGAILIVAITSSPDAIDAFLTSATELDLLDPGMFVFAMLSIIVLIPSVWAALAIVWRRHARFLLSVEGRLRWRWMLRCGALALLVLGLTIGGTVVAGGIADGGFTAELTGRGAILIVLVLLLVPLQSAAEEYVFRGFGLQLIGSWVRSPVLPLIGTTLLFAAGHIYEFWGLVDVGLFGLAAGWLTIRTGGLEAAIAIHVVNNTLLFVLGAVGLVDPTGSQESVTALHVLPTAVSMVVLVALLEWQARRSGLVTTRAPQPPAEPPHPPAGPHGPPAWHGAPPAWHGAPQPGWHRGPAPHPRPVVPVPPNAPPYPGQLTDGWR